VSEAKEAIPQPRADDDPPQPNGRRAAFFRAVLIACIPLVPAAIGVVIWMTALGGTVGVNTGRITALDGRIGEIDMHGSRMTQLLDARIRMLEIANGDQDRRLAAIEMALNQINARELLIEERQKNAIDGTKANGDKLDALNRLILDHLQRQRTNIPVTKP
jgi:hypothetical protein